MAGQLSLRAEIFHCLDQPRTEVHLPETVDRHARRQGVRRIYQPPREAEPVALHTVRQRRQARRHAGGYLLSVLVIGAANQDGGVARCCHFLHHHGGGDCFYELLHLLAQGNNLLPCPANSRGCVVVEEIRVNLAGLFLRPCARLNSGDAVNQVGCGGELRLFGGKSARINAHVVDVPVKTPVNPAERADAEGFVRLERLIEVIEKDPQFRRFSVDVDLDAARDPGAVVGRQDVMPPASREGAFGLHPERVVQPSLDQIELNFSLVQGEAVPFGARAFRHARHDRATSLRQNPRAQGELVIIAEVGDIASIDKSRAVEARRPADKSDDIERVVPGVVRAFAKLDDALAPCGNRLRLRERLELQTADKVEQCLVLGPDAGQRHALVAKSAQEQRARRIELAQLAQIERAGLLLLRPPLERLFGLGHGADVERAGEG